jgi:hypothetical protein
MELSLVENYGKVIGRARYGYVISEAGNDHNGNPACSAASDGSNLMTAAR